jgi:hypothetical protein
MGGASGFGCEEGSPAVAGDDQAARPHHVHGAALGLVADAGLAGERALAGQPLVMPASAIPGGGSVRDLEIEVLGVADRVNFGQASINVQVELSGVSF